MGSEPTPAGSNENFLVVMTEGAERLGGYTGWHWGAWCKTTWATLAIASKRALSLAGWSWLSGCCPYYAGDKAGFPSLVALGTLVPVIISNVICIQVKWWCGMKCHIAHPTHWDTLSTNQRFINWLKNNSWAPWTHMNYGFKLPFANVVFF